ncbi:MAG: tol-pal system protein YbgF [Acidobacteriota bacterium]
MRLGFAFLIAALLIPLVGCTSLGGGGANRDTEIEALRRDATAARRRATVAEVENRRLLQEIERLENELEAARRPTVIAEPDRPTIQVEPGIESSDIATEPLTAEPPPAVPPMAVPPSPDSSSAGPPVADATTSNDGASVTGRAPQPGGADVVDATGQAIYDEGYTLFHRQQYDGAEARFAEFLGGWGRSDLADNAQFWIGECRYARDDYRGALEAFLGVVERYPEGNKVPDAMLKAGKSLEALGDPAGAAETYDEIVKTFPNSAAAAIARELRASLP